MRNSIDFQAVLSQNQNVQAQTEFAKTEFNAISHSGSFTVIYFGVSKKAVRDYY